jgi:hypothetical protein
VLGVGAGSFDQGDEDPLVDPLGVGETGRVDRARLAADGLASRLGSKESPSNSATPSRVAL